MIRVPVESKAGDAIDGLVRRRVGAIAPAATRQGPGCGARQVQLALLQRSIGNRAVVELLAQSRQEAAPVVQRILKPTAVNSSLQHLLEEHGQEAWYSANWPAGVKAVTGPIAAAVDTNKDNVVKKLRAHPTINPLLRGHRMALERHGSATDSFDDPALDFVYNAYKELLFFHATDVPGTIYEKGLDPNFAGSDTGITKTRSVRGQAAENLANVKNRVYVTRKHTEAKGYVSAGKSLIQILIPKDQRDRLTVDNDSQFGFHTDQLLYGVGDKDGNLNFYAQIYLKKEVDRLGAAPEIFYDTERYYKQLLASGALRTPS